MLALAGCDAARTNNDAAASRQDDVALPAPVLEQLDTQPLRDRAQAALREQRIHTPAGDNAVEYYLALREREADAGVSAALAELQPYVLIAAEQSLALDQRDEARRLLALLARMDPHAPALPRLRDGLRVAQERADREEGARIAQTAPLPAPIAPSTPASTIAPTIASPPPAPQVAPAPVATVEPPPALAETPPPPVATARAEPAPQALPRLLRDAAPRYPLAARNRRIEGSVQVAFTIQPDGSVTDVHTVSAQPEGLFEQAALAAASRWQFEATSRRVNTTRTLTFRLPAQPNG
ncbi:energy transducer TonB [Lysobacter sp. MMG2]|uniref:energy transducer TonB n=2 Tax=unclassified Lysobacter TaxID=2635362 RepID=UPI001C24B0F4|nr:energy transducer TonB [Lysobacter sp. MMG2]